MTDLVVLGTDTDAGKTTFCLLLLAAFPDEFEYWKPIESGPSDSETIAKLHATVRIHPVAKRFAHPVAPPLAAELEGLTVPSAAEIAAHRPRPTSMTRQGVPRSLLIETFGSPFSPLNATELQLPLVEALGGPTILVSSSKLGAVGRTLACLRALRVSGIHPVVVLLGPVDKFAENRIAEEHGRPVYSLSTPDDWETDGIFRSAVMQQGVLQQICTAAALPRVEASDALLVQRDRRAVWHPYTSLHEPDDALVCVGAKAEFLLLEDGRRIIDGISSWWTILHGHRYPPLMEVLHEAAERFDHVLFAGVTHPPAVELAELLLTSVFGKRGGRVFYSDNGSTAVEVALKMAYQYWCHHGEAQRTRFIGFENSYHGDTFGAMSVGRDPVFFGRFEPLLFKADILPLSAERLDDWLSKNKNQTAAVILEPLVQGAGGMRMHMPEMLRSIFEITKKHDVLFIADEVMTGGGRTGTLWAHQAAGIAPDLVCAGKTLAGGILPLAATLVMPHIVDAWQTDDPTKTFFHGHSFTAHPLACAIAVANWKLLTTKPLEDAARIEAFWNESLDGLRRTAKIRDVRIKGTIAAVELNATGGYLADVGRRMRRHCINEGVLLRPLGPVLYAMPPFCTSTESLRQIAKTMISAVMAAPA